MPSLTEIAKLFSAGEKVGWREYSACRDADPDLFFKEIGESYEQARALCSKCPVIDDCLHFAVSTGQRYGFWGGRTERQRRELRREYLRAGYQIDELDDIEDYSECECGAPAEPIPSQKYAARHARQRGYVSERQSCQRALACRRLWDKQKKEKEKEESSAAS